MSKEIDITDTLTFVKLCIWGSIFWTLVLTGYSWLAVILILGYPYIASRLKNAASRKRHDRMMNSRSTKCRRCGSMVRPQYQSARGRAVYHCGCGRFWTIRW